MGVAPASATAMLKKLAALGLVEHEPYRGVALTPSGRARRARGDPPPPAARAVPLEALGLPLDDVHAEADRLEHALSEELEARIDASLGFPTHDPHGDPIPSAELELDATRGCARSPSLEPGDEATIRRVPDGDARAPALPRRARAPARRARRAHAAGAVRRPARRSRAGGAEHAISRELAAGSASPRPFAALGIAPGYLPRLP